MSGKGSSAGYDAIVVGSGAAGGWAAKELCEAGLRVALLEAGRSIDTSDYPHPAPPERPVRSRARAILGGQHIQMRCNAFNGRTSAFFVNDRDNPYTTPTDAPFNWFRGRQVGGRLHTWARVIPRLSPFELSAASRDGYGVDWPLSYDELAPYYERIEEFLGACGERDGLQAIPDGTYRGPTPLTAAELEFRDLVEAAFPERRVISARLAAPWRGPVPPTIVAAQRTGRLELRPDTVVRAVTVDPRSGRATGVEFVDRRRNLAGELRSDAVVLCASAIETLRILLNSRSRQHPRGLGNSSGHLGCYLMDRVVTMIGGRHPGQAEPLADGDPYDIGALTGFQIPRFRNLEERSPEFRRGYGVQGGICRGDHGWYLLAQGEMLAHPENRVTLNPRVTDRWGVSAAHISCRFGANERAMAADQLATLRELAATAGLQWSDRPPGGPVKALAFALWRRRLRSPTGELLPGSAIHESGGAGMGDNPERFVLDRSNRCWDADNVLVTDGAAFPSGCWQNVTLTIMALTVRACQRFVGGP